MIITVSSAEMGAFVNMLSQGYVSELAYGLNSRISDRHAITHAAAAGPAVAARAGEVADLRVF